MAGLLLLLVVAHQLALFPLQDTSHLPGQPVAVQYGKLVSVLLFEAAQQQILDDLRDFCGYSLLTVVLDQDLQVCGVPEVWKLVDPEQK